VPKDAARDGCAEAADADAAMAIAAAIAMLSRFT
jgi:hypothetical protein